MRQANESKRKCPVCNYNTLMDTKRGDWNPRNKDGVAVCVPCKMDELRASK